MKASIERWAQGNAHNVGMEPDELADLMRKIINGAHQHYPDAATELRDRLNSRLRGEDPGTPLHWKGMP